jgi:hypothetical protein
MREHTAAQVAVQFLVDEARHARLVGRRGALQEARQVRPHDSMKQRVFGSTQLVLGRRPLRRFPR